jgi:Tfp pilus assembly protein PilP
VRGRARQSRLLREAAVSTVVMSIFVAAMACNRDTPPSSPVQSLPLPATHPVASVPQEERRSPATYQSRGRRDPFRLSRMMMKEKLPTVHLTLTGIVREAHAFYALVESDLPPGMGYVIRENDVVDSAKVVKITKDSVVFEIQTKSLEGKLLTRYVEKHLPSVVSR